MAVVRSGRTSTVLSSVPFQITLYLSAVYFLFYFLSTLCMIVYKSQVLSYPDGNLTLDLCLLFLMAALELLRLYWAHDRLSHAVQMTLGVLVLLPDIRGLLSGPSSGSTAVADPDAAVAPVQVATAATGVKGNLQESERGVGASLAMTGGTVLLCLYFLLWQSYVLRADVIINAALLAGYLLAFLLGFVTLARFASAYV